jgi:hypothetical protein
MMKHTTHVILTAGLMLIVLAVVLSVPSNDANAIPAFARKYRMSCTTCHAPIPQLKPYGDDFAGNGFVLADQDAPRYFVETGDENLSLIRDLPFAIRLEGFMKHETRTDRDVDLSSPYNVKLLSGGALSDHLSYYFYFLFSERGEVAGLEDAFLMFNNLFGTELDVYVGQFAVSDPLLKRELRLTYEDYQIYRLRVGDSKADLNYDRGIMLTYGFESGTDVTFEVINGNGLAHADDLRVFDDDKYKHYMLRLAQGVGENLGIGGFAYYGKENDTSPNEVWMFGPDANLAYRDKVRFNVQYVERRDDNPYFFPTKPSDKIESRGGLAELIWMPDGDRSRWYTTVLYNQIDSDIDSHDYQSITGHIGYLLRTNVRLVIENSYDIENEENRFLVGFVAAY